MARNGYIQCKVDDCEGNAHYDAKGGKGFCHKHYQRWKRHGDPLKTKITDRQQVIDFIEGHVFPCTSDECLIWPFPRTGGGYAQWKVDGKKQYVHRAACEHRNGPPPSSKHEAAHSCGSGHLGCVNPQHLSWKTHQENMQDTIAHGRSRRGTKHHAAKLLEEEVRAILALKDVYPNFKLAEMFGVDSSTISNITTGENWSWLSEEEAA